MRAQSRIPLILLALTAILLPVTLQAQNIDVQFHWAPAATEDAQGNPCAEAVSYEIYYQRDGGLETLIAAVDDTSFVLIADPGARHRIRVRGVDKDGRPGALSPWSAEVYFETPGRSADQVPPVGSLRPNYPNPFNPETHIVYGVPDDVQSLTSIKLAIFDLKGQRVRTLKPERTPGWHTATWNGQDDFGRMMPTGQYLTLFSCDGQVTSSKMTMVK